MILFFFNLKNGNLNNKLKGLNGGNAIQVDGNNQEEEESHTVRVVVSTCRHGRRRTGTTVKGSGKGLLLDRGRYVELPLSQDDAFSLEQTGIAVNKGVVRCLKRIRLFLGRGGEAKSSITNLLLKPLGLLLRFEGDEAVAF